jgi:hypothetical protein
MELRPALGSPPSSRTIRSVECESSQITGRSTTEITSTIGAASSAMDSARWSPIRFGVSSPSTSET